MEGIITITATLVAALVFFWIWKASLRPAPREHYTTSSDYRWDLERPERWQFAGSEFDVHRAKELIVRSPRKVELLDIHFTEPILETQRQHLIGPGESRVDLQFPLLLVPDPSGPIVIDGWHRIAQAIEHGIFSLPAIWLTEAERQQIESKC